MEHQQDKNAFAYVLYEKATIWLKEEGPSAPWKRTRMFYAADDVFGRDDMWAREVEWRDPENIRVVPLFDEDANLARRDDNLNTINAKYIEEMSNGRTSLADAVNNALESNVTLEDFEGLIRTLKAFQNMLYLPMNGVTE